MSALSGVPTINNNKRERESERKREIEREREVWVLIEKLLVSKPSKGQGNMIAK